MLILDQDINFYFKTKLQKQLTKNVCEVLNTFENIKTLEHLLPRVNAPFPINIFKYKVFQRS